MKTLLDLYKSHTGKVSDKWSLYLHEYDRLFAPYREQAISMLEIGIQNGGSVEIWSQYFPNARKFVGCDINPDCNNLNFEDSRITVIVGDATTAQTRERILQKSLSFDLIIDDGSHTSGDIVKSFLQYFPMLRDGGLFVVEDLHCSYWEEYEGGLFYPYSSLSFFKLLVDIVNHEHWGTPRARAQLIEGFSKRFKLDIAEDVLAQIASIEFINSVCVVKKSESIKNTLGRRLISGSHAAVLPSVSTKSDTNSRAIPQNNNQWSTLPKPLSEAYEYLKDANQESNRKLAIAQAEIEHLRDAHTEKNEEVTRLTDRLHAVEKSKSWRYTRPIRSLFQYFRTHN